MGKWEYMKLTNMPNGKNYLVRKKGGVIEDWNSQRKTWQRNNDAIGAFIGMEDGYKSITEIEASNIIKSYIC